MGDLEVYVVVGWPITGTRSDCADVIGVWANRAAFDAKRAEVEKLFTIGWGYTMKVES